MIITPEQKAAIEREEPVQIEDPGSRKKYVLISAETYEKLREALEEVEDRREQAAFRRAGLRGAVRWMEENPY